MNYSSTKNKAMNIKEFEAVLLKTGAKIEK